MSEEKPKFGPLTDYTPDDLTLMTVNFQSFFQWVFDQAKANAPEGQSMSVKASVGVISAEITYTAPASSYRRAPPKPKPLNLVGAQGIVAEYPDFLEQPKEIGDFWFIRTKKQMGETFKVVSGKLRDCGFTYIRYDKDTPNTGGWRAKK